MSGRLDGKVAVITGGGAGIGAAIASAYIKEGAKVALVDLSAEKLEQFAATQPEGTVLCCEGDISSYEDCESIIASTIERFGRLDVLVNNVGIDPGGNAVDVSLDAWHAVMNVNLNGTFYMCRNAIPQMINNGGGSIINISSLAGVRAIPAMTPYSTSKAALVGLTNSIALDFGDKNVRANIISPGATATETLKAGMKELAESLGTDIDGALHYMTRFSPIPRTAEPSEIAALAVLLGSDECRYLTGQNILVDGGASVVDPCGIATSTGGGVWGN